MRTNCVQLLFAVSAIMLISIDAESLPSLRQTNSADSANQTKELEKLKLEVGVTDNRVQHVCTTEDSGKCTTRSMDHFYDDIEKLRTDKSKVVRIVFLGNSLLASDKITDFIRSEMQSRFGDAGPGLLYVAKMNKYGKSSRLPDQSYGWRRSTIFSKNWRGAEIGASGGVNVSTKKRAVSVWTDRNSSRVKVIYKSKDSGNSLVIAGDNDSFSFDLSNEKSGLSTVEARFLEPQRQVRAEFSGSNLKVYGADFLSGVGGIVLDSHGLVAADAPRWTRTDDEYFKEDLLLRNPSLLVVMLGGNETRRLEEKKFSYEEIATAVGDLLHMVSDVSKESSCLVIGPMESIYGRRGGKKRAKFEQRRYLNLIINTYKISSIIYGCSWFNLYESFGGDGAMKRFSDMNILNGDYIHPKGGGFDVIGSTILNGALLQSSSKNLDAQVSAELYKFTLSRHQFSEINKTSNLSACPNSEFKFSSPWNDIYRENEKTEGLWNFIAHFFRNLQLESHETDINKKATTSLVKPSAEVIVSSDGAHCFDRIGLHIKNPPQEQITLTFSHQKTTQQHAN